MKRHLLAAAVLATLLLSASASDDFAFYKLSLIWPTSACNVGIKCKPSIPNYFTIHGLWPTFADGKSVPPYNPTTNKCNANPTGPDAIIDTLTPIRSRLDQKWPSLRDGTLNTDFWKIEWAHHGMCSEYPQYPFGYFNVTLALADTSQYNPLNVMGVQPSDTTLYPVKTILDNVKTKLGTYPQISCNMVPKVKTLQLKEIRFCFKKGKKDPHVLQDCPIRVDDRCTKETDQIKFPPAATSSIFGFNISWQFISM